MRFWNTVVVVIAGLSSAPALAQVTPPVRVQPSGSSTDEAGCKDAKLLPRVPGCIIIQCGAPEEESTEVIMQAAGQSPPRTEVIDGTRERLYYECPRVITQASVTQSFKGLMAAANIKLLYAGTGADEYPIFSGYRDGQWVQLEAYGADGKVMYEQTVVTQPPLEDWKPEQLAAKLADEKKLTIRAIAFLRDRADLRADSEVVLTQLAAVLKQHPDWPVRVEVHSEEEGDEASATAITQQRADAVVAWLGAHGVASARITGKGFGFSKPLDDNGTESGRAKNRRVEVIRAE